MALAKPALRVPTLLFSQWIYKHVLLLRGHRAPSPAPFCPEEYDAIMASLALPI
jgi:hypothetical protein